MAKPFTAELIAPCGMNCGICKAYLAYSRGVPTRKAKYHIAQAAWRVTKTVRSLKEREKLKKCKSASAMNAQTCPARSSKLDELYSARYGMSMVENQKMIKEKGMGEFLKSQAEKYRCPSCGDIVSVHDGKCYVCGYQADKPKGSNPKLRWVPNRK